MDRDFMIVCGAHNFCFAKPGGITCKRGSMQERANIFLFPMNFFSIDMVFFKVGGYYVSYIEFFGTLAGAVAVWLTARANVWGWPVGIINVILFFFLFFQVRLYPDMFLQVFFFVTNLVGWWRWTHPKPGEEGRNRELKIGFVPAKQLFYLLLAAAIGIIIMGGVATNLHTWFAFLFAAPSAFPYLDSFVTIMSIVGTFLMIQKKIECWVVWIAVDLVATGIYFAKDIKFVGMEFFVFCIIAIFGLWNWTREYRTYGVRT